MVERQNLTVFAAGSRGDIQPCVALGRALQAAGYRVTLAAPADFAAFVQQHGLAFHPLRGDVQATMARAEGRRFLGQGSANPLRTIRAMRALLAPVVGQMADDGYAACQGAGAIVCLAVMGAFGQAMAEALRLPIVFVEPTPLLPTRTFPAPGWPLQASLGGLANRLSGVAMLNVIWQWYRPFVNDFRRRLSLPPYSAARFGRDLARAPLLGAYSPRVVAPPADWPNSVHIAGYFWLNPAERWQPPQALRAFLEAGAPPVYIGFGSMTGQRPEALAALGLKALAESGQRGVLATGWGGLRAAAVPASVFVLESAPHAWLFPRMAAVVHHGGAGTTAEGLRAGVPAVVVPFAFDQPFWGARVRALGVGPRPIPLKKLTAERLAQATGQAVADIKMRRRARRLAEALHTEDGLGHAIEVIQGYLGPR